MLRLISSIIILFASTISYAQSSINDLIAARAQQKVKQMTDYVAYMADKEKPIEDRKRISRSGSKSIHRSR